MCFKNNQNLTAVTPLTLLLETVCKTPPSGTIIIFTFSSNIREGIKFPKWPSKAYVNAQWGRSVTANLPVFLDVQAASLFFTSLPLPHTIRFNTDTITLVWSCSWQSESHLCNSPPPHFCLTVINPLQVSIFVTTRVLIPINAEAPSCKMVHQSIK